jgi:hypothetical protein
MSKIESSYHPLNAWASVMSGLTDMVLELNIDKDLPNIYNGIPNE